jgi:hypothetical protein
VVRVRLVVGILRVAAFVSFVAPKADGILFPVPNHVMLWGIFVALRTDDNAAIGSFLIVHVFHCSRAQRVGQAKTLEFAVLDVPLRNGEIRRLSTSQRIGIVILDPASEVFQGIPSDSRRRKSDRVRASLVGEVITPVLGLTQNPNILDLKVGIAVFHVLIIP